MRGIIRTTVVLVCLSSTGVAARTDVAVALNVTAESPLRDQLVECLTSRITQLKNVRLDSKAGTQLRLIALEQKASDGETYGYLFYQAGLASSHDPSAHAVLWETLRSLPPDLPSACDQLASAYETEVIERVRQIIERLKGRPTSESQPGR